MKRLAMVVAGLLLLGCRADLEQQVAVCKFEAQKTYPNVENMFMSAPAGKFIELCMEAAGYVFDHQNQACTFTGGIVVSERPNPYCYVPRDKFSQMGIDLEKWLDSWGL